MYPEDIERLFGEVAVGTPVRTVSQPATAGWVADRLYLEVYPSKTQTEDIDVARLVSVDPPPGVKTIVKAAAGRYAGTVDWRAVDRAMRERSGAPVLIADRAALAPQWNETKRSGEEEASIGRPFRLRL